MQSMTAPRGRLITANTPVVILDEYGAPIQMIQNTTHGDASVSFNGGVAFVVRASETIVFNVPIYGVIESDLDVTVLA